jgi:MoxR-like ATPase
MPSSFQIIDPQAPGPAQRTRFETQELPRTLGNLKESAKFYKPDAELVTALNAALTVGSPLLVTGDPGTGKTQVAYWVAYHLGIADRLYSLNVRSTSVANDLFYRFDAVGYFHAANQRSESPEPLDPKHFRKKQALWLAFESPRSIVLIDEVDKAPRDFPNDLLHALDQYEFTVPETDEKVSRPPGAPPLVVITSNSERRLPEPFLRRCIFHHIQFTDELVRKAVESRVADYPNLDPETRKIAIARFWELNRRDLRKKPATAELLIWLVLLSSRGDVTADKLRNARLSELPALGALIKDRDDLQGL